MGWRGGESFVPSAIQGRCQAPGLHADQVLGIVEDAVDPAGNRRGPLTAVRVFLSSYPGHAGKQALSIQNSWGGGKGDNLKYKAGGVSGDEPRSAGGK